MVIEITEQDLKNYISKSRNDTTGLYKLIAENPSIVTEDILQFAIGNTKVHSVFTELLIKSYKNNNNIISKNILISVIKSPYTSHLKAILPIINWTNVDEEIIALAEKHVNSYDIRVFREAFKKRQEEKINAEYDIIDCDDTEIVTNPNEINFDFNNAENGFEELTIN